MIPYNDPPVIQIGNLSFSLFGALVATGVLVGAAYTRRRGKERGIPDRELLGMVWASVLFGFPLSFALNVLFYRIEAIPEHGIGVLFDPGMGMSSFGGFLGAFVGAWIYVRKVLGRPLLPFADVAIQGLVVGWIFGRLGCTLVHDHVGQLTDFFLATRYPEMGTRHNLGMYEFLYTILVLFPTILWMRRRLNVGVGWYVVVLALEYGPVRFGLDFLRARDLPESDDRYGGMTFAQYCCLACIGWGLWMAGRLRRQEPRVSPLA